MLETPSGPIKGIKEIYAETGEPFYEFRGIPFGKPPIGPLRFKKSIPFGTWKDTLDATAYGARERQHRNNHRFMLWNFHLKQQ
jgi:carboxylesterase type B